MSEKRHSIEETKEEIKHPNFTRYLTAPSTSKLDKQSTKAIPFAPGIWDDDGFVIVSDDQKKITFELQQGNYNDN